MTLKEWVEKEAKRLQATRTAVIEGLAECSGVSRNTISGAVRGMLITRVDKAGALSDATRGEVTLTDLVGS